MKKSLIFTSALALFAFASCNKTDQAPIIEEATKGTATIKLEYGLPTTKADEGKVAAEALTAGPGNIFFVDAAGVIVRHVEIKASGASGDNEINVADLAATATIKDVLNTTTKCYILMNHTLTLPAITEGTTLLSAVTSLGNKTEDMFDNAAGGGVKKVPLWGEGNVDSSTDPMTVAVSVKPIGTRLQIEKITGITDIVSFKVEGIFINNYYPTVPLVGALAVGNITNNGSTVTKYTNTAAEYATTYAYLKDYAAAGLGNALSAKSYEPSTLDVWGYNIFPNERVVVGDQKATRPMIVVRLKDVVWDTDGTGMNNETLPDPCFITVKGLKAGASLDKTEAGKVYTFGDIQFERKHITTQPVTTLINTDVTVTLMSWVPVDVTPEYN